MKKLKIPLTAVALMIGVAGAFATKVDNHSANRSGEEWFVYNGGDINNPANYSLYTQDPENGPSCNGNGALCAIQAQADQTDPMRPDLDTQVGEKKKD